MKRLVLWVDEHKGFLLPGLAAWFYFPSMIALVSPEPFLRAFVITTAVMVGLAILAGTIYALCRGWTHLVLWARGSEIAPPKLPAADPFLESARREVETIAPSDS